eukprot:13065148-Alexandrium_andersonii.AAC.1
MCIRDSHGQVHEDANVVLHLVPRELHVELRLIHKRGDERGTPREEALLVLVLTLDEREVVAQGVRE